MKPQIAIIGYAGQEEYPAKAKINKNCYQIANKLGKFIGSKKWIVVTGGKSGIMESACKGCQQTGGTSVGVISGPKRFQSNKYVDVEIVTNGYPTKEESLLIAMSDVIILIGGGAGSLIELAIAYKQSKPIIIQKNTGGWADKITQEYLDERKKSKIIFSTSTKQTTKLINEIISKKMFNKKITNQQN